MSPTTFEPPYALIPVPPLPTNFHDDHAESFHVDMALIHNVIIRGLNSCWVNAPLIKPKDEQAFAGYVLTLIVLIGDHHHGEETIIFPFLQTKFDMGDNINQHAAFHDGIEAFKKYFLDVKNKREKYDAEKTMTLLKAFADMLVEHLHGEIPTISPERMKEFDKTELGAMLQVHENYIKGLPGVFTVFPFVIGHHDYQAAPQWPPLPVPIKIFTRYIAGMRYPSYWQFSPFTTRGAPQNYAT